MERFHVWGRLVFVRGVEEVHVVIRLLGVKIVVIVIL
jgi:hypothetical protein